MQSENISLTNTASVDIEPDATPLEKAVSSSEELTNGQRVRIMLPLLIGGFTALLNETILNVAFPAFMKNFHVSMSTIQWLATAYMLIIGVSIPVAAFLLKTFSTRKLYFSAMVLFTIGTICCGFSVNFHMLLISRMIQGTGTGMLLPIMMNTIMQIYPPAKRGTAMGVCSMVIVAAPGIGPTMGGLLLHHFNWPWLFFSMLPIAIIGLILGQVFLKIPNILTKPKIDIPSIFLSTIGFGGLIFSICSVENLGLLNTTVLLSFCCGIIGLILFIFRQLKLPQPMLELRCFRFPRFSLGIAILFLLFMLPFATNIILPTYMQSVLGISPTVSGLALMPGCLLNMLCAPLCGLLYDRVGVRIPLFAGLTALIISMFLMTQFSDSTIVINIILLQSLMNLGMALTFTPLQTNTLNQLPRDLTTHGVAITNTMQQIGAAYGASLFIGLLGAIESKRLRDIIEPSLTQQKDAIIAGTTTAFTAALILVIIGLLLAFFLKQRPTTTRTSRV